MTKANKIFKELDLFIYMLLLCYMLVDCMTGFLRIKGLPGVSQPYKMLLMLLMILSLKSYIGTVIYCFFFGIISINLIFYFFYSYTSFSDSLAMLLRIVMAPILFIYLKKQNEKEPKRFLNIIKFNTSVLFINLLLGLLGFGGSTYENESALGIKGFFYDGNALAATLFAIYVLWINLAPKNKVMISIVFLFFGFLIGTKVSVFSVLLYFILWCFLDVSKGKRFFALFILTLSISVLVYVLLQTPIFQYQIDRIKWLLKLFKGNYISVFLSGRNLDLNAHYEFYKKNFSIREFLFGFGFLNFRKIIELDFFDTFFSYGLIFFLGIFVFYCYCLYINRKNKKITIFNLLYFCLSITSGHIWFNSQVALFFSLANIIFLDRGKKINETHFASYKHVSFKIKSDLRYFCKTNL